MKLRAVFVALYPVGLSLALICLVLLPSIGASQGSDEPSVGSPESMIGCDGIHDSGAIDEGCGCGEPPPHYPFVCDPCIPDEDCPNIEPSVTPTPPPPATATATPVDTPIPTATPVNTPTETSTPIFTGTPTLTATVTNSPTGTLPATGTATATPVSTSTSTATAPPTKTPTPGPLKAILTVRGTYRRLVTSGLVVGSHYTLGNHPNDIAARIDDPALGFARTQVDVVGSGGRGAASPAPQPVRAVPNSCSFSNLTVTWSSEAAESCTLVTSPAIRGLHNTVATSGSVTLPGPFSRGYTFALHCGRGSERARARVDVQVQDTTFETNDRPMMSAAFGTNSQGGIGITANNDTEISRHLARACRNLGYDRAVGFGLYNEGFTSPGNNTNCWIADRAPRTRAIVVPAGAYHVAGTDIVCKNAEANGNPRYIGSFKCACN